jgi:hypothetical protein
MHKKISRDLVELNGKANYLQYPQARPISVEAIFAQALL